MLDFFLHFPRVERTEKANIFLVPPVTGVANEVLCPKSLKFNFSLWINFFVPCRLW